MNKKLTENTSKTADIDALQQFWRNDKKKLPPTNCILYADGSLIILDFVIFYDPNTKKSSAQVSPLCDTNISSILKYNHWDNWISVDVWNELIVGDNQKFVSGDGSYGNEGFIAREDSEGNLVWAMFFDHTNPIKELKIENNWLIGITEHSESQIEINLNNLTDIKYTFYNKK